MAIECLGASFDLTEKLRELNDPSCKITVEGKDADWSELVETPELCPDYKSNEEFSKQRETVLKVLCKLWCESSGTPTKEQRIVQEELTRKLTENTKEKLRVKCSYSTLAYALNWERFLTAQTQYPVNDLWTRSLPLPVTTRHSTAWNYILLLMGRTLTREIFKAEEEVQERISALKSSFVKGARDNATVDLSGFVGRDLADAVVETVKHYPGINNELVYQTLLYCTSKQTVVSTDAAGTALLKDLCVLPLPDVAPFVKAVLLAAGGPTLVYDSAKLAKGSVSSLFKTVKGMALCVPVNEVFENLKYLLSLLENKLELLYHALISSKQTRLSFCDYVSALLAAMKRKEVDYMCDRTCLRMHFLGTDNNLISALPATTYSNLWGQEDTEDEKEDGIRKSVYQGVGGKWCPLPPSAKTKIYK